MRAFIVSVNYTDILSVTLPWNRHHFEEINVITDKKGEKEIRDLLWNLPSISTSTTLGMYATDAFYDDGANFNKWKALEQGLDIFGRHGWICLLDADILWPKKIPGLPLHPGYLFGALRRMYDHPITNCEGDKPMLYIPPEIKWGEYRLHPNVQEWAGYTQIFHASDPVLIPCAHCGHTKEMHPLARCRGYAWHDTAWRHAGGADSFFQKRWKDSNKVRLPFEVLHIGPAGVNWCGRTSEYLGGDRPAEAEQRRQEMERVFRGRHGKQGEERFRHEKLDTTE